MVWDSEGMSGGMHRAWGRAALGRPASWECGSMYFPFNCDVCAETDRFSQMTGLPAGLLTCSVYFQPMNLLMKMSFTWEHEEMCNAEHKRKQSQKGEK